MSRLPDRSLAYRWRYDLCVEDPQEEVRLYPTSESSRTCISSRVTMNSLLLIFAALTAQANPSPHTIGATLVGRLCSELDLWTPEPIAERIECSYREKQFKEVKYDAVTLIYEKVKTELDAYYCKGHVTYQFYPCEQVITDVGYGVNLVILSVPLGNTKVRRMSPGKRLSHSIKFTKSECEIVNKEQKYTIDHNKSGYEKTSVIKLGVSGVPRYADVVGTQKGDRCVSSVRIRDGKEFVRVVVKSVIEIHYGKVRLDAYKTSQGYRIHFKEYSHKASEKGHEGHDYTLAYNLSSLGTNAMYRQKTFNNVQVVQIGNDRHRHINVGKNGKNEFLEIALNAGRDRTIQISENQPLNISGTAIRGLFLCFECAEDIKDIEELLPDQDTQALETRMQFGRTGIRLKLISENFVVIENRLCEMQNILDLMHEHFPESVPGNQGLVFKKENGISYHRKCQNVEVYVLNTRSYCTRNVPVLYDGSVHYLEFNTQVLLKESELCDCKSNNRRFRVIEYATNRTLDLCGGSVFKECSVQLTRDVKKKLHEIDTFHVGDLFTDNEYERQNNLTQERAEEIPDYYEPQIEMDIIVNDEDDDRVPEDSEPEHNFWDFFNFSWMIQSAMNWLISHIKNILFKIPLVGVIFEFLLEYSDEKRGRITLLALSFIDTLYNCVKSRSLNPMHIVLGVAYFFCPILFLYVKSMEKLQAKN